MNQWSIKLPNTAKFCTKWWLAVLAKKKRRKMPTSLLRSLIKIVWHFWFFSVEEQVD